MHEILISGANIAGPTLAYWLARHGFKSTIIERNPGPRAGGQAIDIRGVALDVIDAMGMLDTTRARKMEMRGCSRVDKDGNEIWRSEEMTFSGGRFDSNDVELLRDDLADILLEGVGDQADVIYGDSISEMIEDDHGVTVKFKNGPSRRFDLVIGADGMNSAVRRLAFGPDQQFLHNIGHASAVYTAPNILQLDDWQVSYREPYRRFTAYTARKNSELRLGLIFSTEVDFRGAVDAQKEFVASHFTDIRWKAPELLECMRTTSDFYFGVMAQVRMEHWTRGRCALVGDAGYGPTPFSGQGTSLAIVGAYVLAHEMGQSPDNYPAAFERYEQKLRSFALRNQALALGDRSRPLEVMQADVQAAARAIELDGLQ